jgi:uncharacterized membrane protein YuzA (DUF378 family)
VPTLEIVGSLSQLTRVLRFIVGIEAIVVCHCLLSNLKTQRRNPRPVKNGEMRRLARARL